MNTVIFTTDGRTHVVEKRVELSQGMDLGELGIVKSWCYSKSVEIINEVDPCQLPQSN